MGSRSAHLTILVIDDEKAVSSLIREVLEYAGYSVVTACDGLTGIASLAWQHVDLILCDGAMPYLDGAGVCHLLEEHQEYRTIPIILMSGAAPPANTRAYRAFLPKPFDLDDLLAIIANVLDMTSAAVA